MDFEIKNDQAGKKFYIPLEGGEAYLKYEMKDTKTIEYISTFVSEEHRGTPYGRELVKYALQFARDHKLRVIPTCPYVKKIISRNEAENRDIIEGHF